MSDPDHAARGRRLELRRHRRHQRVRVVALLVTLLAVAAAAFAIWLAADAPEAPALRPEQPEVRTQSTLLLQVQLPDRTAGASVLLAHDPDEVTGAGVLVPPQLLVTVPGTGSLPFGRALSTVDAQGSRDALSDLMGVTVEDGWVLPADALTALVDAVGGIPVEVDVPVIREQTVVLDTGAQRVDGAGSSSCCATSAPRSRSSRGWPACSRSSMASCGRCRETPARWRLCSARSATARSPP